MALSSCVFVKPSRAAAGHQGVLLRSQSARLSPQELHQACSAAALFFFFFFNDQLGQEISGRIIANVTDVVMRQGPE